MEQQVQFEDAEKILSWREMQKQIFRFINIENRGTNSYGKPISVVTLETEHGQLQFYAPPSLYWELKRRPASFTKYEGVKTSTTGYEYPVFKFAK